jgi:hypothetical protein
MVNAKVKDGEHYSMAVDGAGSSKQRRIEER